MFDTKPYEEKMAHALEHFQDELKKISTGRAHPGMLDGVMVEAYGAKVPLNQVGNIVVPEPQLLQINAFDLSTVKAISDAIRNEQSLGFNPSDDGRVIRVPIPALTGERRQQIVKLLGEKVEECRIAMRTVRQDAFKQAKIKKEAKELSEDDVTRVEKEIDRVMGEKQIELEGVSKAKEQEILTI